jgi:hypothetical protein
MRGIALILVSFAGADLTYIASRPRHLLAQAL